MIEFFTATYFVNKMDNLKQEENEKIKEMFSDDELVSSSLMRQGINVDALNLVAGIIALIISVMTAQLAYNCNIKKFQNRVNSFCSRRQ